MEYQDNPTMTAGWLVELWKVQWRMGAGSTVTLLQSRVTGECRMGVGSTVTVTGVGLLAVGLYLVRWEPGYSVLWVSY